MGAKTPKHHSFLVLGWFRDGTAKGRGLNLFYNHVETPLQPC